MKLIVYVIVSTLNTAIEIVTLMMFIRAILSWFPAVRLPDTVSRFLYGVTEAVISPVRRLMSRSSFVNSFPLDLSFLATYILLHLLQTVLSSFYSMF